VIEQKLLTSGKDLFTFEQPITSVFTTRSFARFLALLDLLKTALVKYYENESVFSSFFYIYFFIIFLLESRKNKRKKSKAKPTPAPIRDQQVKLNLAKTWLCYLQFYTTKVFCFSDSLSQYYST